MENSEIIVNPERVSLIFGKTGTGKTTLAKQLVKDEPRLIIIDALEEYNFPDIIIVENFNDLVELTKDSDKFKIACKFTDDLDYEFTFRYVFELTNVTLLLEEARIYIQPGQRQSGFLHLVRYGRHRNVKLIGIARRSSELSRDFRALTEKIYTFKQTDIKDVQALEEIGLTGVENLEVLDYKKYKGIPVLDVHYKEIIL